MQRIQSITLRNFKFFYGDENKQEQNKIKLNQNNLLLYGENGSGKSSIYWALYTFLQSCLKKDADIEKYFDPTNSQNLRNRFASNTDDSAIILEIISPTGTIKKEISNNKLETNKSTDTTINKIIAGSDFINYKYLSKLYDFRNSEEIDLFPMFEREVLMFVDFEKSYTDNNGELSSSTLASDWWNFICTAPKTLPANKKNYRTANRYSNEYKSLVDKTIPIFIKELKGFLNKISATANDILKNEFNESFKVNFDTTKISCEYNNKIGLNNISKPKIPLKIIFDHSKLSENTQDIERPHTFLNEARLTAIALAIRLAMLDERLYDVNSASLLVLDDLLLSLDMSHRDKVLDIILKKVDEYQILILTHDRAFYNLCKRRIENRSKESDIYKWEFKEMYQHTTKDNIPCPFIPDKKSYLDLAIKYLKEFDYPACANYLRKESERVMCSILPEHLIYKDDLDSGCTKLMLDGLIGRLKAYFKELGIDYSPFEKLKEHKDVLMNPLSHDNIDTPIYKQELLNSIEIIEKLNKLEIKTIGQSDATNTTPFILKETDKDAEEWEYTFYLKENFRAIKDQEGKWFLSNPKCFFDTRKNITTNSQIEVIDFETKLSAGYSNIRFKLGIKTKKEDIHKKEIVDIVTLDGNGII